MEKARHGQRGWECPTAREWWWEDVGGISARRPAVARRHERNPSEYAGGGSSVFRWLISCRRTPRCTLSESSPDDCMGARRVEPGNLTIGRSALISVMPVDATRISLSQRPPRHGRSGTLAQSQIQLFRPRTHAERILRLLLTLHQQANGDQPSFYSACSRFRPIGTIDLVDH